jgi:hypothetical protein
LLFRIAVPIVSSQQVNTLHYTATMAQYAETDRRNAAGNGTMDVTASTGSTSASGGIPNRLPMGSTESNEAPI